MMNRRPCIIVCAAIRKDSIIIAGPRHFDSVMLSQIRAIAGEDIGMFADAEQGFVDQYGQFWSRIDAMMLARTSGQPLDMSRNGSKTSLYSEGLY